VVKLEDLRKLVDEANVKNDAEGFLTWAKKNAMYLAACGIYMPKLIAVAELAENHECVRDRQTETCRMCEAIAALEVDT
jgi:hypothetical protein